MQTTDRNTHSVLLCGPGKTRVIRKSPSLGNLPKACLSIPEQPAASCFCWRFCCSSSWFLQTLLIPGDIAFILPVISSQSQPQKAQSFHSCLPLRHSAYVCHIGAGFSHHVSQPSPSTTVSFQSFMSHLFKAFHRPVSRAKSVACSNLQPQLMVHQE